MTERDILAVLRKSEQTRSLASDLSQYGLYLMLAENAQVAIHLLNQKPFEFFLLELVAEGADILLELSMYGFQGIFPYLIVAADFTSGLTRTEILERGADACIQVPVDAAEVAALYRAICRRYERLTCLRRTRIHQKQENIQMKPKISHLELIIDPSGRRVFMQGKEVPLTEKEFDVLYLLARYPGIVLSSEQIYENVWKSDYTYTATAVSDRIYDLRKKLGLDAKDKQYIETIYGATDLVKKGDEMCRMKPKRYERDSTRTPKFRDKIWHIKQFRCFAP